MTEPILSEAEYDAITDAAAHWCMRLHEQDCTAAERAEFDAWLKADPLHAFEYEAMLEIWDVADHLPRPAEAEIIPLPVRRPRWPRYGVAAAVSLLAIPLAGYIGWNLGWVPSSYQSFEATGQVERVTLADGSHVELNLGTRLTYSDYKNQRRVTLKYGEAFFDVSHDTGHPFVVKAAKGQVRVTGTKFNVWMYEDQVRVTLLQGSVLVSSDTSQPGGYRLDPGMQARYKAGDYEPQISQTYANDASLAWRNGKLILDNLSLSDALPLINRYLSSPVLLADPATGAIRIGGIYSTGEVKKLITSLPKVLPVYLTQNKDGNPVLNSIPRDKPRT
ncbi:FecR family protein [Pseudomonas gingeri]|uniref:FecR family protein n=1 Tax=Pseudomonas gingeri TaxID=117681 RepID=UPI0015A25DD1|nr:FecR family protein [Pseudomonas gingeri]NWA03017.1 FecR family protein [Pseudomonas gingeri]NWA17258.1 FecR family protein [Pseudomonas gingeri]NWA57878.1 FecR family protein [Pseudomonas gingeri]NWA98742.1 FecR family protein [Pseudomonas gingeri]NWB02438.1 FecR family protein [Pseudomonas gingeri]